MAASLIRKYLFEGAPISVLKGHLPILDGVRGLAILLVMAHHFTYIGEETVITKWWGRVAHLGIFGVDLFFVLSGFLITGILLDSKDSPHFLRNFYIRRTLRIFPLYYAVIAVSFLILPRFVALVPAGASKMTRLVGTADGWFWYVTYLANFLIASVNNWHHPVLGVTWSLSIEEQFYIFWAIAIWLLPRHMIKWLCLGLIIVAPLFRTVLWFTNFSWLQIYVLTPGRIDALAWGGLLSSLVRFAPAFLLSHLAICRKLLWCSGIILLVAFTLGWLDYQSSILALIGYSQVAFFLVLLLYISLCSPQLNCLEKIFISPFLRFFGKYSYSIYLFHLPVRAAIRDVLWLQNLQPKLTNSLIVGQVLFYIIATLAVIPLSLVSWYLFEKHILRLKRYFPSGVGKSYTQ